MAKFSHLILECCINNGLVNPELERNFIVVAILCKQKTKTENKNGKKFPEQDGNIVWVTGFWL